LDGVAPEKSGNGYGEGEIIMGQEGITNQLDRLLNTLETALREADAGDAIGRELAAAKRETQVESLRQAAEVRAFREALIDGLIRVDTVNQLLRLVKEAVVRLLA